jgi:hypothetical protein
MTASEYHFVDRWRVEGDASEVASLVEDGESLPRWWPSVYLDVTVLEPGDEREVGRVLQFHAKGWLPYTLRWKFRVTEKDHPRRFALEAFDGDFEGTGVWTFEQDGPHVNVTFDWRVRSRKPLIRALTPVLRPVFRFNHNWCMRRGEESVRLELARRRAKTAEEAARVPRPPGPTFPHNLTRRRAV